MREILMNLRDEYKKLTDDGDDAIMIDGVSSSAVGHGKETNQHELMGSPFPSNLLFSFLLTSLDVLC